MTMKSTCRLQWILPLLLFGACRTTSEQEQIAGAAYSRYYIQDYVEVENLSIQTNSNYVGVVGHGRIISGSLLCSKYNDTGFNRTIALHSTTAVANRFTAIDIVSDSDFDERHKAGASLADITFFAGASANNYIRSGYTQTFDWQNAPSFYKQDQLYTWYNSRNNPVYIRLSEIGDADLALLNPVFFLVFESQPTASKSHRFVLTITDEKGKRIAAEFDWNGFE